MGLAADLPGDPTRLAYTVFGHPLARCAATAAEARSYHPGVPTAAARDFLKLPRKLWQPGESPPGALLRADHGVVPFHRREEELADLDAWSREGSPVAVRLYTGPGGMGKTRLALELCRRLRDEGWRAGVIPKDLAQTQGRAPAPAEVAAAVIGQGGPLLVVVDYAEERRDLLLPLLRRAEEAREKPIRVLLLARSALDWWDRLREEREGVGELLRGPVTRRVPLKALAPDVSGREETFATAGAAFAEVLGQPPPKILPEDLVADYFERVLLLHMSALVAMEGVKIKGDDEGDGVLDAILDRERRFWRQRLEVDQLPTTLARAVGRALAVITLGGGVAGEEEAVAVFRSLTIFEGQPEATLVGVAHLLRGCYPGEEKWIEPIQPDLLGEHLIQRELEQGTDEILDRVFGPRESG